MASMRVVFFSSPNGRRTTYEALFMLQTPLKVASGRSVPLIVWQSQPFAGVDTTGVSRDTMAGMENDGINRLPRGGMAYIDTDAETTAHVMGKLARKRDEPLDNSPNQYSVEPGITHRLYLRWCEGWKQQDKEIRNAERG